MPIPGRLGADRPGSFRIPRIWSSGLAFLPVREWDTAPGAFAPITSDGRGLRAIVQRKDDRKCRPHVDCTGELNYAALQGDGAMRDFEAQARPRSFSRIRGAKKRRENARLFLDRDAAAAIGHANPPIRIRPDEFHTDGTFGGGVG
jgi:hypothetical protein